MSYLYKEVSSDLVSKNIDFLNKNLPDALQGVSVERSDKTKELQSFINFAIHLNTGKVKAVFRYQKFYDGHITIPLIVNYNSSSYILELNSKSYEDLLHEVKVVIELTIKKFNDYQKKQTTNQKVFRPVSGR